MTEETEEKDNSYQIGLTRVHRCTEDYCATMLIQEESTNGWTVFKPGPNPSYIDGKCDKFGGEEKCFLQIAGYDPENWEKSTENGINPDEIVIKDETFKIAYTYPLKDTFIFTYYSKGGFTRKQVVDAIVSTYRKIYQEEEETAETIEINYQGRCRNCQEEHLSQAETMIFSEYQQKHPQGEELPPLNCLICLGVYQPNESVTTLNCSDQHHFHTTCIETWIKKSKTCPICRAEPETQFEKPCGKCQEGTVEFQFSGKVLPIELRMAAGGLLNRRATNGMYGIWGHDIRDLVIERLTYDPDQKILDMFIGS